jgi:hypothetical protein
MRAQLNLLSIFVKFTAVSRERKIHECSSSQLQPVNVAWSYGKEMELS